MRRGAADGSGLPLELVLASVTTRRRTVRAADRAGPQARRTTAWRANLQMPCTAIRPRDCWRRRQLLRQRCGAHCAIPWPAACAIWSVCVPDRFAGHRAATLGVLATEEFLIAFADIGPRACSGPRISPATSAAPACCCCWNAATRATSKPGAEEAVERISPAASLQHRRATACAPPARPAWRCVTDADADPGCGASRCAQGAVRKGAAARRQPGHRRSSASTGHARARLTTRSGSSTSRPR